MAAMLENDSIHAFQRSTPRRTKEPKTNDSAKQIKDDFIMDTNNSSIVSKRSVEKLYYAGEPEYFRYFVSKFKRRSPIINRGYWLRMRAIEHTVQRFLEEPTLKRKVVVNLGCGYDPLPWLFLGKLPALCKDAVFVDVDYPQLMLKKYAVIDKTPQLKHLLPGFAKTGKDSGLLAHSTNYAAVGCDLRNLDLLKLVLQDHLNVEDCSVAVLFVAEVSVAYMTLEASQAVLEWAAGYQDVRFCLLEQHLPDSRDHPFAQTMLEHFDKLRTPLHAIGTIPEMRDRFVRAGWPTEGLDIRPLWELWSDTTFLSAEQRRALDRVEPFDEWEEFALFASHYFLMVARRPAPATLSHPLRTDRASSRTSGTSFPELAAESINLKLLPSPHSSRRFAAVLPPSDGTHSIALHAGLGTKERLSTSDVYSSSDGTSFYNGPPLRSGLMCHTITKLGNSDDCLLVGGRTSPNKASADCWLRSSGVWEKVEPLPKGRYRHSAVSISLPNHGGDGVLVVGGKTGNGIVIHEPLLWTRAQSWRALESDHAPQCRFGAVLGSSASGRSGYWNGGMTDDGIVLEDWWSWWLTDDCSLEWRNVTDPMKNAFGGQLQYMFRFGAQLCFVPGLSNMLVGGIIGKGMLTRENEFISLYGGRQYSVEYAEGMRPLLVGHSLAGPLILGGGATCFSFGTHWSASYYFALPGPDQEESKYRVLEQKAIGAGAATAMNTQQALVDSSSTTTVHAPVKIPCRTIRSATDFKTILDASQQVVLTDLDIGPCIHKWTNEYLLEAIGGDRPVVVHTSPTSKMDFQTKNFTYATMPFNTFLASASSGERLYLRSLSAASPSSEPTNLSTDYPSLASDFTLPQELAYITENAHSSPLRISGPVTMWLHYDVMANILCQIRGSKTLLLYPPSEVSHLAFPPGASSSSLDPFTTPIPHTHPQEVLLKPGECLFIPPLWAHTAEPEDGELSVAVNVFFRSWEKGYAAGRDVYGNRDVAAYEKGRKDIEKIAKAFDGLPDDVRSFYLHRLSSELGELGR